MAALRALGVDATLQTSHAPYTAPARPLRTVQIVIMRAGRLVFTIADDLLAQAQIETADRIVDYVLSHPGVRDVREGAGTNAPLAPVAPLLL